MRVKQLAEAAYRIVAVMEGETCPAEDFLASVDASLQRSCDGMVDMLHRVAERGLAAMPHAWSHEVDKKHGIYEFIKGDLRLFYFKGKDGDIAVCSGGVVKKGQKVSKAAVARAVTHQESYFSAIRNGTYQRIEDDEDEAQQGTQESPRRGG